MTSVRAKVMAVCVGLAMTTGGVVGIAAIASGDSNLEPGSRIRVTGTGTSYDGRVGEIVYALGSGRRLVALDGFTSASGLRMYSAENLEAVASEPTPTPTATASATATATATATPSTSATPTPTPTVSPTPTPTPGACAAIATSGAELRSNVERNAGKTVCVDGTINDVDLRGVRPSELVTIRPRDGDGDRLGRVSFRDSHNIRVDALRLTAADIEPGTESTLNRNLQFANCRIGGESSGRISPLALLAIRENTRDVLVENCELAWTNAEPDGGYAIRAIDANRGRIDNLRVVKSHIHHIGADALQLDIGDGFLLDRTEIDYVAAEQGSDEHSDSLQIMGIGDNSAITNNYIHHIGFRNESHVPVLGDPAGQLLVHGWSGRRSVLFRNNLIRETLNYGLFLDNRDPGVDGWTIDHNTFWRNGCCLPSSQRGPMLQRGTHAFTNNVTARMPEGAATLSPFSGNVASALLESNLQFSSNWELTGPQAGAGYHRPDGVHW